MSGKKSKTVIGAFVLGALALLVAGILFFGSGRFFTETRKFVIFFPGAVKGLEVGSPVIFRGVKVGSVTDIHIEFNSRTMTVTIPVIAEIEKDRFRGAELSPRYLEELVDKGLRAQLQMQSLLTGQVAISLDFFPDTPVVMRGTDIRYPEIPAILSTGEELQKTLAELPLQELVEQLQSTMKGINRLVNSPALHEAVASLGTTAKEVQAMVKTIELESRTTAQAATRVLNQAEVFLAMDKGASGEIARNINQTLTEIRETFDKTDKILQTVRETALDERTFYELRQALREMAEAARSIRTLADFVERHPETLLRGKSDRKGE
jgi:paraquat-inducible protein B